MTWADIEIGASIGRIIGSSRSSKTKNRHRHLYRTRKLFLERHSAGGCSLISVLAPVHITNPIPAKGAPVAPWW